jgi:DNA-binding beta-propeller fold protein YncE
MSRTFLRLRLALLSALGAVLCLAANAQGVNYDEVKDWPIQARSAAGTPAGPWNFGQVAAVASTAGGNILVFHRGAHPIMEFDVDGTFLGSWGDGLISGGKVVAISPGDRAPGGSGYTAVYGPAGCYSCGAHSIRVDGDGNIWVVDACAHVVYKMDPHGRVLMQLGTKGSSGTGPNEFNLPTDVAFAPNGDIYVSDGYGSARVLKFSADGTYLLQWGKRGTGPGEFGLPHNLVTDDRGRVYVTDRDNRRIQVFGPDGKFLEEWSDTGGISTLYMTEDQHLWAGGVLRNLTGEVVASLPGEVGGHGTTVTQSGAVFIAQLGGKVQKFVKR